MFAYASPPPVRPLSPSQNPFPYLWLSNSRLHLRGPLEQFPSSFSSFSHAYRPPFLRKHTNSYGTTLPFPRSVLSHHGDLVPRVALLKGDMTCAIPPPAGGGRPFSLPPGVESLLDRISSSRELHLTILYQGLCPTRYSLLLLVRLGIATLRVCLPSCPSFQVRTIRLLLPSPPLQQMTRDYLLLSSCRFPHFLS